MFKRGNNNTHINASEDKTGNIYMNAAASRNGTTAVHMCRGGCSMAAPDPIPEVVYTYWKLRSLELKQLSVVTSAILESPFSAKMISTHCMNRC